MFYLRLFVNAALYASIAVSAYQVLKIAIQCFELVWSFLTRRKKMEVFYSCSSNDSVNHDHYSHRYYLCTDENDDEKLVKLCRYCSESVCAAKKLSGLIEASECSDCGEWYARRDLMQCGQCENCCNCYVCSACDSHTDNNCNGCDNCNDCCTCNECRDCSNQSDCEDCGRCCDCCGCRDHEQVQEGSPWRAESPRQRKTFNCSRLVGVEWEYNSCEWDDVRAWSRKWRGGIHEDGSCGQEAVTAPLSGDFISLCLTDLGNAFRNGGAEADDRCGIHVHVDAGDLKWADMYRFLWVYSHVEPVLFLLAGQQRINNHYCRPCGIDYRYALGNSLLEKSKDRKGRVLEVAFSADSSRVQYGYTGRNYQRRAPGKKDGGRYRALNLCPWLAGRKEKCPDTTVEFRLHRNSLDPKRVIGWAQLCARLVDWSAKATDKEAQELPKSALRALCQVIAPDCAPWILNRVKGWRADLPVQGGNSYRRRIHISEGRYRI